MDELYIVVIKLLATGCALLVVYGGWLSLRRVF